MDTRRIVYSHSKKHQSFFFLSRAPCIILEPNNRLGPPPIFATSRLHCRIQPIFFSPRTRHHHAARHRHISSSTTRYLHYSVLCLALPLPRQGNSRGVGSRGLLRFRGKLTCWQHNLATVHIERDDCGFPKPPQSPQVPAASSSAVSMPRRLRYTPNVV